MKLMRVAQISGPKSAFEILERPIPAASPGTVRIKVSACGICHSDALVKEGLWPGIHYPRVPGHEVVGVIDALGAGVANWDIGQAVGVGWHGGHCGQCEPCRRGQFFMCDTRQITGINFDGGYAEYMVAPVGALVRLPGDSPAMDQAPLLCAGVTTFEALRHSGAKPGNLVAVLGLGGLGHLGVQFAAKMGFKVIAVARGRDKERLAAELGAAAYIDSQSQDPGSALQDLGGASAILSTVTAGAAITQVQAGLAGNGTLMLLGVAESLQLSPALLILGRRSVQGWYCGASIESQDTLRFSALNGVHSRNEYFPLDRVNEAYERMISGKARFRVVLTMEENR